MKLVITKVPIKYISYYQWLFLGLYTLNDERKIKLRFRISIFSLIKYLNNKILIYGVQKFLSPFLKDSYCLEGYYFLNNKKVRFCYDISDTPYLFNLSLLKKVDFYFKAQCPKEINNNGFKLAEDVVVSYIDSKINKANNRRKKILDIEKYKAKIFPSMIGVRNLAFACDYKSLRKGYENYSSSFKTLKNKKLMCYFGNSLGPKVSDKIENFDMNSESDILKCFYGRINHPNEKRYKASEIINKRVNNDSRVINIGNSDYGIRLLNKELIIPLNLFCEHISNFEYNLNISGYRLSIPNRFVESFIVGTGIVTDKLHVKWYLPFGKEVFETIDMGYNLDKNINWNDFERDINSLPNINGSEVKFEYDCKWSPKAFATYIVDTLNN